MQVLLKSEEVHNITLLSKLWPMKKVSWVSPSRNFAMGFFPVDNNAYLLSIWFNNISTKTIAWSANRDRLVGNAASLEFTGDGNLVLINEHQNTVWASNTTGLNVRKAEMRDTGDFVLLNQSSQPVWESFDSPTDTLLPDQELKQGFRLISQQSSTNFLSGRFEFTFLDGQVRLLNRQVFDDASVSYWSPTYNVSAATPLTVWKIGVAGDYGLYNGIGGSPLLSWITPDYGLQPPRRLTLDPDGNLRIYSWDSSTGSWLQKWKAVTFDCSVDGFCGPYGICYSDSNRARCRCPLGYHPVDPHDVLQGCKPDKPISCYNSSASMLVSLENTDFPRKYDTPSSPLTNISQLDCTGMCSKDCNCVGVAYYTDGTGKCYFKVGGLINGQTTPSTAITFLVKVASSEALPPSSPASTSPITDGFAPSPQALPQRSPPNTTGPYNTCKDSTRSKTGTVIAAVASSTISATVVFIFMWVVLYVKRQPRHRGISYSKAPGALSRFSYTELQTTTNNFRETLGSGGFGSVYKGELPDLGHIAVKKLDKLHQGEKEFKAEVETIGSIHHFNLIRLYGFCSEGSHRLLVYEYLSNGSLDRFLFKNPPEENLLEWSVRFKIALGTARAIAYLHEECRECIIHCDIKPQNILLDDRFNPKVSDFGLAKLLQKDQTRTFTTVRGTRGYVAPEWFANHAITVKVDVYSYGMVLLELLAVRKNYEPESTRWDFGEWAFQQMEEGKLQPVAAEALLKSGEESQSRLQQVERVVKVALWCIQQDASLRPTMGKVVQMLEGSVDVWDPSLSKLKSAEHIDTDHHPSASHSSGETV